MTTKQEINDLINKYLKENQIKLEENENLQKEFNYTNYSKLLSNKNIISKNNENLKILQIEYNKFSKNINFQNIFDKMIKQMFYLNTKNKNTLIYKIENNECKQIFNIYSTIIQIDNKNEIDEYLQTIKLQDLISIEIFLDTFLSKIKDINFYNNKIEKLTFEDCEKYFIPIYYIMIKEL